MTTEQTPLNKTAQTHMRKEVLVIILAMLATGASVCSLMSAPAKAGADESLQNPALKQFYSELQTLFRKHYPKATSHLLKDKIHFEHDTRVFIVHEAQMTGEWQDPWETRGPKPGGILCDIRFQKGQYQGQAVAPQTFDKRYFKILLLAPYSGKPDAHLVVHLSYPRNVKEDFLRQFTELINDFGKYVD
jgi:hypothetical protein